MIYIYETWKDNDNALFILINDVRQSVFIGWIEQKLSGNVTTAVECQIS